MVCGWGNVSNQWYVSCDCTEPPPPPPPPKNDPIYYVINRCYFILDGIHSWAQLSPFNTTWLVRIITGWTRPGMCSRLEVWTLLD